MITVVTKGQMVTTVYLIYKYTFLWAYMQIRIST